MEDGKGKRCLLIQDIAVSFSTCDTVSLRKEDLLDESHETFYKCELKS
jgi:hypothetical protein